MARYIDADYVIKAIGAEIGCGNCKQSRTECLCQSMSRQDVCGIIDDAPTADVVERKRGKWIYHEAYKGARFGFLECSCCGEIVWLRKDEQDKFCRNCGAEMEREE